MLRKDEQGTIVANSSATGFHWMQEGYLFLFKNWHVVTGINPITGMSMGSFVPNSIRVANFCEAQADIQDRVARYYMAANRYEFSLDTDDPISGWLTHPSGKEVDLAALKISWKATTKLKPVCLNLTDIEMDFEAEVGDEVFVVGFPEGHQFERKLPLWKRGTVATDISLDQAGQPQYYIDTVGNSGLSGSPVLHRQELSLIGDNRGRTKRKYSFAGVYAGRLAQEGLGSQVGRVIKPSALFEVLNGFEQP